MKNGYSLILDADEYLRKYDETESVLYPDSSYYRKDKQDFALHKSNRIFKSQEGKKTILE